MTAQRIDGRALAQKIRDEIRQEVAALLEYGIRPGLAVILAGENPASRIYVQNKINACKEAGVHSVLDSYAADVSMQTLLTRIQTLNQDPDIHGILIQLPLPTSLCTKSIMAAVLPQKDVDGFHASNAGALMIGQPGFLPCTPHGCIKMLEHIGITPNGKHAVVVGRSSIAGKPMALMLLQRNATVTICHSATADLAFHTRQADILVVAAGRAGLIRGEMVKPGAVVLDVGINRQADGSLKGDVDFDSVQQVAGYLSPVPGGVGAMTIAMLLSNTLQAARQFALSSRASMTL